MAEDIFIGRCDAFDRPSSGSWRTRIPATTHAIIGLQGSFALARARSFTQVPRQGMQPDLKL